MSQQPPVPTPPAPQGQNPHGAQPAGGFNPGQPLINPQTGQPYPQPGQPIPPQYAPQPGQPAPGFPPPAHMPQPPMPQPAGGFAPHPGQPMPAQYAVQPGQPALGFPPPVHMPQPATAQPPQAAQPANKDVKKQEPHPSTQDPNYRTGQLGNRSGHIFTIPPHPNTQFDEAKFLALLEGSISLTMEEKQRVIDAIPRLAIEQINELISIFEEEKQKFAELEKEFADDVAKLKAERENEIVRTENKKEEASEADDAAAEAEALKRQMMGEAANDNTAPSDSSKAA